MHIVTATVPGSAHLNAGRSGDKINNQDAVVLRKHSRGTVVVLCDGCSAEKYSGTGADIGANIIARAVCRQLPSKASVDEINWSEITEEVTKSLGDVVRLFVAGDSIDDIDAFELAVVERFLFTAMVLVIINDYAIIAYFGDGQVAIDDRIIILEAPIKNSPAYIGYLLIRESGYHVDEYKKHLAFSIVEIVDINSLEKGLIVGTDGLKDLKLEDLHHPALLKDEKMLQSWLNDVVTEKIHDGRFVGGKCKDDTSLVLVRSEQAQQKLLEEKQELVSLKKSVEKLSLNLKTTKEALSQVNMDLQTKKNKIAALEQELETISEVAEKAGKFEMEIRALRNKVKSLSGEITTTPEYRSVLDEATRLFKEYFLTFTPKKQQPVVTVKPAAIVKPPVVKTVVQPGYQSQSKGKR